MVYIVVEGKLYLRTLPRSYRPGKKVRYLESGGTTTCFRHGSFPEEGTVYTAPYSGRQFTLEKGSLHSVKMQESLLLRGEGHNKIVWLNGWPWPATPTVGVNVKKGGG